MGRVAGGGFMQVGRRAPRVARQYWYGKECLVPKGRFFTSQWCAPSRIGGLISWRALSSVGLIDHDYNTAASGLVSEHVYLEVADRYEGGFE